MIVCPTEDLPPAQRQMLATIIAAPDHKISQEKVMERAFIYEPGNEQLVKELYGLHMTAGDVPQAQQVIDRYENICTPG